VLAIIVGVLLVAYLVSRRRPSRGQLRLATAATVTAIAIGIVAGQISRDATSLAQARNNGVAAERGRDECFGERTRIKAANRFSTRLPFALWARRRMGRGAIYSFASFAPPPDNVCLYFVLLPALPAAPGERPDWTIAYGAIPAAMRSRIAARDPSVQVFAPGFALESDGAR